MPSLTLVLLAPLIAEVLPGATRFSALFVLPIEICVWGGGALLIRYAARRLELGWIQLLFLALALAVAEECLIQQSSLAPLVIQLKGQVYARAGGINYLYLLWALIYEPVFVVLIPISLVELIFPDRRERAWLSTGGLVAVSAVFLVGARLAWYAWTQIARPKVFHVPAYHAPLGTILLAAAAMAALIFLALGPIRFPSTRPSKTSRRMNAWLTGAAGALWAIALFGVVLLAFGIAPALPVPLALLAGFVLAALALTLAPRMTAAPGRTALDRYALIFGTMLGSMLAGFVGFFSATRADLFFKIGVDVLAVAGLIALGNRLRAQTE